MRASSMLQLLALAAVTACGGKAVLEEPAPEPAPPPSVQAPPEVARVDDAAERERLAREQAAREAAERARAAVVADMTTMIHFEYDQAVVRPADQGILDRKASIMQANSALRIRISGHADERGSDEYNLALGNRRAGAAKRYLENKGVDGTRIEVVSYGEERPLSQGSDENAWAQNRRAEFEITAGGDNLVAPS